jgi:hypothetical protein
MILWTDKGRKPAVSVRMLLLADGALPANKTRD